MEGCCILWLSNQPLPLVVCALTAGLFPFPMSTVRLADVTSYPRHVCVSTRPLACSLSLVKLPSRTKSFREEQLQTRAPDRSEAGNLRTRIALHSPRDLWRPLVCACASSSPFGQSAAICFPPCASVDRRDSSSARAHTLSVVDTVLHSGLARSCFCLSARSPPRGTRGAITGGVRLRATARVSGEV